MRRGSSLGLGGGSESGETGRGDTSSNIQTYKKSANQAPVKENGNARPAAPSQSPRGCTPCGRAGTVREEAGAVGKGRVATADVTPGPPGATRSRVNTSRRADGRCRASRSSFPGASPLTTSGFFLPKVYKVLSCVPQGSPPWL